jgi:hypothetical protein
MLFVIISSILLNFNTASAAISPESGTKSAFEVPFYKSTNSLFPSGSTTIENLKKQIVGSQKASAHLYKWNKIYFNRDEIKPLFATHLSRYVIDAKTTTRYKVVETNVNSVQLFSKDKKKLTKRNINEVIPDAYDTGFVMALKDIYLRTSFRPSSSGHSTVLTTIPPGTRLAVNKYVDDYALVKYQNYEGYINLSELITKFDFASFVFAKNEWHQVRGRNFDKIMTSKNLKISLNDIKGVLTPDNRGIIASNNQKIPMWSQVEVTKNKITTWNKSLIKEHGTVWWKTTGEVEQIYYTVDELLKKQISSVSFHPNNPLKGILSSDGVYITEDGYSWRKLQKFDGFNGPVNYFNDLLLFVGNFRSTDGGKTFDNYIQIDKLASAIEYQFGFVPKKLQVRKIETFTPFRIKIEIETDHRKIKMESPFFSQDWKAVKG